MAATTTTRKTTRFFVRGPDDTHEYESPVGKVAFCVSCQMQHARPVGRDWHIEGDEVDTMLCGMTISLDDCEVRTTPPRVMCADCAALL